MTKCIIFDFDGTIVDSMDMAISVYNELADKHEYKKIRAEDKEYLRTLTVKEKCNYLEFPMYKIPFLAPSFYRAYKESMKDLKMFGGIKEVFEQLLHKGYQLAIISSNSEDVIRDFLHEQGVDYIDNIVCSSNLLGKDKVMKKFLKKHKLQSSEALYIGDEVRDIVAAKKCGIPVVWVEWGFDIREKVEKEEPTHIVATPEEILSLV
ncbi:HAD-IA family hydrolase [Priestia taiwanensis]|uniref:Phosphoglycolate phosphatase n=1 Tax=Priestia taiwanensis TaxID=1347902 RepID=A0A917ELF3_9BACI|nr:HAD-IA family hydrolase [Priestia taiwanensis]MBM7361852.1 phosphoglycolate phosphatase [Priestia taiwanensis]GGE57423.1 phosphoglycolate phosphatase [Priestia taiwanensis]